MTVHSRKHLAILLRGPAWAAFLGLCCFVGNLGSRSSSQEPTAARPPFQAKNEAWLSEGVDKHTEQDVVEKLGNPDRVELGASPLGGEERTYFIWEDRSRVEVDFSEKDGKAVAIRGTFSPHVKAKRITQENFRKLKLGMTEEELGKILGGRAQPGTVVTVKKIAPDTEKNRDIRRVEWTVARSLLAEFTKGKLSAVLSSNGMLQGE
jgi:hypothetical protein